MKNINIILPLMLIIQLISLNGVIIANEGPIKNNIRIEEFSGPKAKKYFNDIAKIRMNLFKEFPYLYEGNLNWETEYLDTYFKSNEATILLAFNEKNKVVAFSNSIPLKDESVELTEPFIKAGLNPADYLYIGEVMIYPDYRGKGIVQEFFKFHEDRARKEGYHYTALITVDRQEKHPLKPANYRELGVVWSHFGYKLSDLKVHMAWPQVDASEDVANVLSVWIKKIE